MNAYFQLVADGNSTAIRLVPPTDGGEKLNIAELTEYLHLKKVEIADLKMLYQVASNYDKEVIVPLCAKPCFPQQEMLSVRVSEDRMEVIGRFYPPSSNGAAYDKNRNLR